MSNRDTIINWCEQNDLDYEEDSSLINIPNLTIDFDENICIWILPPGRMTEIELKDPEIHIDENNGALVLKNECGEVALDASSAKSSNTKSIEEIMEMDSEDFIEFDGNFDESE